MRHYVAHDPIEYQTGFLNKIGLRRVSAERPVEYWENPDVGFAATAGSPLRVECTSGTYTMPFGLRSSFDFDIDCLHAGIVFKGSHSFEFEGGDALEGVPAPFVSLERSHGGTVQWEAGQKVHGVEISVSLAHLRASVLPYLGLDDSWLHGLVPNHIYTQVPEPIVLNLRAIERAIERHTLTEPLLESFASLLAASLAQACTSGEMGFSQHAAGARTRLGKRSVWLTSDELAKVERAHAIAVNEAADFPGAARLAHRVGLSEQKLKAGFMHLYGQTPWAVANAERMRRAERLLTTTDLKVAEVALEVGYRSTPAFISMFKSWSGLTPQQYRTRPAAPSVSEGDAAPESAPGTVPGAAPDAVPSPTPSGSAAR